MTMIERAVPASGRAKVYFGSLQFIPPTDVWDAIGYKTYSSKNAYVDIRGVVPNYEKYTIDSIVVQLLKWRTYRGESGYFYLIPTYNYFPEVGIIQIGSDTGSGNMFTVYDRNQIIENGVKITVLN